MRQSQSYVFTYELISNSAAALVAAYGLDGLNRVSSTALSCF